MATAIRWKRSMSGHRECEANHNDNRSFQAGFSERSYPGHIKRVSRPVKRKG